VETRGEHHRDAGVELTILIGGPFVFHLAAIVALRRRLRWVANVLVTGWAALAVGSNAGIDGLLAIPAWLLLVSPATQSVLAGRPIAETEPPLGWPERGKVAGYALLSGLVPGLGQLLHRRWASAAALFVAWLAAWVTHLQAGWVLLSVYALSNAGWLTVADLRARRAKGPGQAR